MARSVHESPAPVRPGEVDAMNPMDERSIDAILLPERLDGRRTSLQPEKRLMLAVLEGAVSDFQNYATVPAGRGKRLFADAVAWLDSSSLEQTLDFENVCQALGLDASFVRCGLRRWHAARLRAAGPSRSLVRLSLRRVTAPRMAISATS